MPEPDDSFDFLATPAVADQRERKASPGRREEFPFLVAEHAFDARSLDAEKHERDPNAVCLSFSLGELAFVHLIHPSGWGDVTLVRSGERGWIPVDYFSGFADARAMPLLAAVAAFLNQPRSQKLYIAPQRVHTFSEAAINEIISGTKALLTRLSVLSRDAALVQEYADIASARKALLTELAHLVHVAKSNKHTSDPEVIEKLVRGCYRMLERLVVLLSAVDARPKELAGGLNMQDRHHRASSGSSRSTTSTRSMHSNGSGRSGLSGRSGFSDLDDAAVYRINSFSDHTLPPDPLDRLREVVPAFFFYLDHFLDPGAVLLAEPDSPSTPSIILALTRHSMLACRELLVVLDSLPTSEFAMSSDTKDELLSEIRKLVGNARSVVAALPPSPASLRQAAAQNMAATARKCHQLTADIAQTASRILMQFPNLSLPSDRSYPVFKVNDAQLEAAFGHLGRPVKDQESMEGAIVEDADLRDSRTSTDDSNLSNDMEPDEVPTLPLSPQISPKSDSLSEDKILSPARTRARKSIEDEDGIVPLPVGRLPNGEQPSDSLTAAASQMNGTDTGKDELVVRNDRIRGGSLAALVRWLTGPKYADLEFEIRTFLLTFRLFARPRDVVIEFGSIEPTDGVKHLARRWIESFWEPEDNVLQSLAPMVPINVITARRQLIEDGRRHSQVTELVLQPFDAAASGEQRSFSSSSANSSTASLTPYTRRNSSLGSQFTTQFGTQSALNLAASFREFSLGSRRASRHVSSNNDDSLISRMRTASQASLSEGPKTGNYDAAEFLLSRSVPEVANQLTLMWFDIFRMLRPSELLDQRFASTKRSLGLAPHVTQLILSSNHLTAFVGDTILNPDLTTKHRARVLKHWIKLAEEMFTIGNLNGTVTIVLTLQSTRIMRLSKAWEAVGGKLNSLLAKLIPLTAPDRNFQEYRKELRSRQGSPCIPYLGLLLGDLTLIDEGNPKLLKPSGAINFDRYLKSAHAIALVQPFQQSQFKFTPDVSLQALLRSQMAKSFSQDSRDSDDQWRRSLLIQPADQ